MKYLLVLLVSFLLTSCLNKQSSVATKTTVSVHSSKMYHQVKAPADNKITESKVELGKMLYFDPRLSIDGTISCNSCHNVMNGGSDNRAVSVGVGGQKGGRGAPTVFNAAFLSVQFWDGRAASLEDQAIGPLTNPIEMGMPSHDAVMERVKKLPGYVAAFKKAFNGGEETVNIDNLAKAIATYERTLITTNSSFDKFKAGTDSALTDIEKKGWENFQSVGCISCHSGNHFAGPELEVGQGFYQKFPTFSNAEIESKYAFTADKGRMEHTKNAADKDMWRVPTLRNIAQTSPYFHNGKVKTLSEAVTIMAKLQLNKDLTAEQRDSIVAFLGSLSGTIPPQTMPVLPPTAGESITDIF